MLAGAGPDGLHLAEQSLGAVIQDFQVNGTMECVDGAYHGVVNYVDSVTAVYAAARSMYPSFPVDLEGT